MSGVVRELILKATNAAVKKKALGYIKAWAKQFEDTRDPNLALMGELYDQLRRKSEPIMHKRQRRSLTVQTLPLMSQNLSPKML